MILYKMVEFKLGIVVKKNDIPYEIQWCISNGNSLYLFEKITETIYFIKITKKDIPFYF